MNKPKMPPIPPGGRLINFSSPPDAVIMIKSNPVTGTLDVGSNVTLPVMTLLMIILQATIGVLGTMIEKGRYDLNQPVIKGENKKQGEENGNENDNNQGNTER